MRERPEIPIPIPRRQLHKAQPVAMRVEPHRLRVDGNDRSEVDAFGKVPAVKLMGHPAQRPAAASRSRDGAQEKTRTSTSFRPLEPESSASTNSATWAPRESRDKPRAWQCQRAIRCRSRPKAFAGRRCCVIEREYPACQEVG